MRLEDRPEPENHCSCIFLCLYCTADAAVSSSLNLLRQPASNYQVLHHTTIPGEMRVLDLDIQALGLCCVDTGELHDQGVMRSEVYYIESF